MTDEAKLSAAQERGQRAADLMGNSLLQEAFLKLEEGAIKQWREETDQATRDRLWLLLKITGKVKKYLMDIIGTGKMASRDLARLDEDRKRRKAGAPS